MASKRENRKLPIFIFDIGNVVIRWPGNDPIFRYIASRYHVPISKMKEAMWHGLLEVESGVLSSDDYMKQSLDRVGKKLHKNDRSERLIAYPFEKYVKPNKSAIRLVKSLRAKGYQVFALSNTSPSHVKVMARRGWVSIFDGFFASCELDLLKPNREIYLHVLKAIHATPGDVIYIDDNEANVRGAEDAGIRHAIHFHGVKNLKAQISKVIRA